MKRYGNHKPKHEPTPREIALWCILFRAEHAARCGQPREVLTRRPLEMRIARIGN